MDDQLEIGLQKILKKNRIVWGAVFAGMLGLLLVSITLYHFNIIDPLPIVQPEKADNITLVVILLIILIIFYIKQKTLSPAKLIEKSKNPNLALNNPLVNYSQNADAKRTTFLKCIQIFNRNMLIVWFLADLVVLTAFVNFILAPNPNKLVMYGFVGLFSLFINFPSFRFYKIIYQYIYE